MFESTPVPCLIQSVRPGTEIPPTCCQMMSRSSPVSVSREA